MTTATEQPNAGPPRRSGRRREALGDHVARVVVALQEQALRQPPRPEAVSTLARLRRGVGRTPGFDYTLATHLAVPDDLLGFRPPDDAIPADTEYAVHDAITLFALHQQSRSERMHTNGQGLGQALARLARASTGPEGVRRRFAALGTASTYPESIYHLRSLVTMLREHQIPLDYGLIADDLRKLRKPERRPDIQAIWGREYFRSQPNENGTDQPATTNPEERSA
ncbi:type I-E CRISPR-associated protein Cse2/CasB [Dactylosporangium sp. NPDC000244]|uniref:type I-E CRISPR-associated protein Cse2/CasB n=1 Tax=Dactylosporangium sp. NPDC000244 TaxID=3154365 RepID=UPI0033262F0D